MEETAQFDSTTLSPRLLAATPHRLLFFGGAANVRNDAVLEKLTVEFLRDHIYWRRNFHPEDPQAIPTHAEQGPEFQAFEARLRRELHRLSAALKRSVPFHGPRHLGHMVSDLALPGLAAQMRTLMNPFLDDRESRINYIERYFAYLSRRIRALNAAARASAFAAA